MSEDAADVVIRNVLELLNDGTIRAVEELQRHAAARANPAIVPASFQPPAVKVPAQNWDWLAAP